VEAGAVSDYVPIWRENRKSLDSRRVLALIVDSLIVATVLIPLTLIFGRITPGAWLIYAACSLTYFHVMETRTGQTFGKRLFDLRVVRASDAGPASAVAISGRTILRLIDGLPAAYIIGLITMFCTGKRRRRLGDLAAGTVVTRASARPYTPAPRSPLVSIYPMVWIGAAVALVLSIGHRGEPYLAQVDSLCHQLVGPDSGDGRLDHGVARRVDLGSRIIALSSYESRWQTTRDEILDTLRTEISYTNFLIADYQRTHDHAQLEVHFETLRSMGARHSRQLEQHYGLKWC
jgi:uncharacterized RDD family membrane protein YckC